MTRKKYAEGSKSCSARRTRRPEASRRSGVDEPSAWKRQPGTLAKCSQRRLCSRAKCHRECHYSGWREGVLEAKAQSFEAGFGIQQLAYPGTTLDSTCGLVLAETKHSGADLCGCYEAVNHFDFGYVLGETVECSSEEVHSRL